MEKSGLHQLINGLNWLAEGGRNAFLELWESREKIENIGEANAWLYDIENEKEP